MHLLLTAMDPSMSRFNPADFDDQTCMEMLFQGFDMNLQARFQDMHENFVAFCHPQSAFVVGCIRCNANEEVTQICILGSVHSSAVALTGTLETRFLPRKLERLRIARRSGDPKRKESEVGGTIDFVAMPDALTSIQLIGVAFSGTVAFRQLPSSLLHLHLSQCVFSGSADLTALPNTLVQAFLKV